mgnify:CR=1 FL=1
MELYMEALSRMVQTLGGALTKSLMLHKHLLLVFLMVKNVGLYLLFLTAFVLLAVMLVVLNFVVLLIISVLSMKVVLQSNYSMGIFTPTIKNRLAYQREIWRRGLYMVSSMASEMRGLVQLLEKAPKKEKE